LSSERGTYHAPVDERKTAIPVLPSPVKPPGEKIFEQGLLDAASENILHETWSDNRRYVIYAGNVGNRA
jgi:hypothetical protein